MPYLDFQEYGRLHGGILEPWGERKVFDQVFFYRLVEGKDEA